MDWLTVNVLAKHEEAFGIFVYELAHPAGTLLPEFTAGAHIELQIGGMIRHYSLANAPGERDRYRIAVQREAAGRGGSLALCDTVHGGDALTIRGPNNLFMLAPSEEPALLLAGGIGITPILAMAAQLWSDGKPFEFHYAARSRERMAFYEALRTAPYVARVRFHFDDGPAEQRLDLAALLDAPTPGRHLYVCGPAAMIDAAIATASGRGWLASNIHFERFGAAPTADSGALRPFEIEIRSSGQCIPVPADRSAAAAMIAAGVPIALSCEQGVCGSCLTGVLEGLPDHQDFFLTDDERAAGTVFLPCCSRAKSARLLLDL